MITGRFVSAKVNGKSVPGLAWSAEAATETPVMTDGEALVAAIIARPEDDTTRLVYADWLEEHGQPERAEFIRVQCELARYVCEVPGYCSDGSGKCGACENADVLRSRERKLLDAHVTAWWDLHEWTVIAGGEETGNINNGRSWAFFYRGFVEFVICTAADWLAHGDVIRQAHPVTRVKLTTIPELENRALTSNPPIYQSRLRGRGNWVSEVTGTGGSIPVSQLLESEWPGVEFELTRRGDRIGTVLETYTDADGNPMAVVALD